MFGVEVAGHKYRQSPTETGGQFRSDQWAGRRDVGRKDFHRSAGQCDLNNSGLQVGQDGNGPCVVDYTTVDQDGCAAPRCRFVCAFADS